MSIIEAQSIIMCDKETNEIVMAVPKGTLRFQFRDDDLVPMVSFVGMTLRDMKLVYADEKRADFLFPFTEEEYDSMVEKFGKFCVIVNGRELERHINYYCEENECDYIFDKVEKISEKIGEIDAKINEVSEGWKTGRMGKVDLTLIRLAVYEMLYEEDVPAKVAINEAVELAKMYGTDNSPSFVNGVLAKLV